jgi:aryl-alcohol dehydrogenase-like predicted oxidoreductase
MKRSEVRWCLNVHVQCVADRLYPPVVISASEGLGIAVVGHSPLGHGFVTRQIKSKGSTRLHFDRFSQEVRNSHF